MVGVLLLAEMPVAVFIEESAAERNSLEELFLPPFMRYASDQFASGAYLNMKRVFSEKKYYKGRRTVCTGSLRKGI